MFLATQARVGLATLPTPLQEARRLREALGGESRCPRILIKRDDLTGLALGGNKARKLEFILADALQKGATVVVTSGAVQSNHARMTAAAARVVGLKAVLVLTSKVERPPVAGNFLLDHLLGAEVRLVAAGSDASIATGDDKTIIEEVMDELRRRGECPYLIPIGGSSPVGVLGYVSATQELLGQLLAIGAAPAWFYYASGSRGTQAGLALGTRLLGAPYRLCGIAVSGGEPEKTRRAIRIADEASDILGSRISLAQDELFTDESYIGKCYGVPTPACMEAIRLLAQQEAIFLDPVYTGKAMAGLIDHVRRGIVSPSDTVVFLHTGGVPALFALEEASVNPLLAA
jgi:D-cysteine desulfhydrase family pyridoxal phosphate-dependent enzyme